MRLLQQFFIVALVFIGIASASGQIQQDFSQTESDWFCYVDNGDTIQVRAISSYLDSTLCKTYYITIDGDTIEVDSDNVVPCPIGQPVSEISNILNSVIDLCGEDTSLRVSLCELDTIKTQIIIEEGDTLGIIEVTGNTQDTILWTKVDDTKESIDSVKMCLDSLAMQLSDTIVVEITTAEGDTLGVFEVTGNTQDTILHEIANLQLQELDSINANFESVTSIIEGALELCGEQDTSIRVSICDQDTLKAQIIINEGDTLGMVKVTGNTQDTILWDRVEDVATELDSLKMCLDSLSMQLDDTITVQITTAENDTLGIFEVTGNTQDTVLWDLVTDTNTELDSINNNISNITEIINGALELCGETDTSIRVSICESDTLLTEIIIAEGDTLGIVEVTGNTRDTILWELVSDTNSEIDSLKACIDSLSMQLSDTIVVEITTAEGDTLGLFEISGNAQDTIAHAYLDSINNIFTGDTSTFIQRISGYVIDTTLTKLDSLLYESFDTCVVLECCDYSFLEVDATIFCDTDAFVDFIQGINTAQGEMLFDTPVEVNLLDGSFNPNFNADIVTAFASIGQTVTVSSGAFGLQINGICGDFISLIVRQTCQSPPFGDITQDVTVQGRFVAKENCTAEEIAIVQQVEICQDEPLEISINGNPQDTIGTVITTSPQIDTLKITSTKCLTFKPYRIRYNNDVRGCGAASANWLVASGGNNAEYTNWTLEYDGMNIIQNDAFSVTSGGSAGWDQNFTLTLPELNATAPIGTNWNWFNNGSPCYRLWQNIGGDEITGYGTWEIDIERGSKGRHIIMSPEIVEFPQVFINQLLCYDFACNAVDTVYTDLTGGVIDDLFAYMEAETGLTAVELANHFTPQTLLAAFRPCGYQFAEPQEPAISCTVQSLTFCDDTNTDGNADIQFIREINTCFDTAGNEVSSITEDWELIGYGDPDTQVPYIVQGDTWQCDDLSQFCELVCYTCVDFTPPVKGGGIKKRVEIVESKEKCKQYDRLELLFCTSGGITTIEEGILNGVPVFEVDTTGFERFDCEAEICIPDLAVTICDPIDLNLDSLVIDCPPVCDTICYGSFDPRIARLAEVINILDGNGNSLPLGYPLTGVKETLELIADFYGASFVQNQTSIDTWDFCLIGMPFDLGDLFVDFPNTTETTTFTPTKTGCYDGGALVVKNKGIVNVRVLPDCISTFERNIVCLTEAYDGLSIGDPILVISKFDCLGVLELQTYWDARSPDTQLTGETPPAFTSDGCEGDVVCSFIVCDELGVEWSSCSIFFAAGEPVPTFYDQNGNVGVPMCGRDGLCPPCEVQIQTEILCAYDTLTFEKVATVQKEKIFDVTTGELYESKWTNAVTDAPFDISAFRIETCDYSYTELCEVVDTTQQIVQVCYDPSTLTYPTSGTSWTYDGSNVLNCTGLGGARSELIDYCSGSFCPAMTVPTGDPANASELLTANNIWDGSDWAGTTTCQWVANFWLNYPLTGTANSVTVSYEIPSTTCHGGYGVLLYDACAGAYVDLPVSNLTGGATAVNMCGYSGFRMLCSGSLPAVHTGEFNTSSVSDLSCLWVVSWAFSRTGTPSATTDQVENVTMNGVLPTSSMCDFNSCDAVAMQLTADDPNGNTFVCDDDTGLICGTVVVGDPALYGDLVTDSGTLTPVIDTTFATRFVPVTLTKSCDGSAADCLDFELCENTCVQAIKQVIVKPTPIKDAVKGEIKIKTLSREVTEQKVKEESVSVGQIKQASIWCLADCAGEVIEQYVVVNGGVIGTVEELKEKGFQIVSCPLPQEELPSFQPTGDPECFTDSEGNFVYCQLYTDENDVTNQIRTYKDENLDDLDDVDEDDLTACPDGTIITTETCYQYSNEEGGSKVFMYCGTEMIVTCIENTVTTTTLCDTLINSTPYEGETVDFADGNWSLCDDIVCPLDCSEIPIQWSCKTGCDLTNGIEVSWTEGIDCNGNTVYPNQDTIPSYFPCGSNTTSCEPTVIFAETYQQESGFAAIGTGQVANGGIKSLAVPVSVETAVNNALTAGQIVVFESTSGGVAVIGGAGYSSGLVSSTNTWFVGTDRTILPDDCADQAAALYDLAINGNASSTHDVTVTIYDLGQGGELDVTAVCPTPCPEVTTQKETFLLCDDGNADFQYFSTVITTYIGGSITSETTTNTETDLTTPYTVIGTGQNCDPDSFPDVQSAEKCDSEGNKWTELSTVVNGVIVVLGYFDENNEAGMPSVPFIACPVDNLPLVECGGECTSTNQLTALIGNFTDNTDGMTVSCGGTELIYPFTNGGSTDFQSVGGGVFSFEFDDWTAGDADGEAFYNLIFNCESTLTITLADGTTFVLDGRNIQNMAAWTPTTGSVFFEYDSNNAVCTEEAVKVEICEQQIDKLVTAFEDISSQVVDNEILCDNQGGGTVVPFIRHYYYEGSTRSFVDTDFSLANYTPISPEQCQNLETEPYCVVDNNDIELQEHVVYNTTTGAIFQRYYTGTTGLISIPTLPVVSCEQYYNRFQITENKVCIDVNGDGSLYELGYEILKRDKINLGIDLSRLEGLDRSTAPPTAAVTEDCNCSCYPVTLLTAKIDDDGTLIASEGIPITTNQLGSQVYEIDFVNPLPDADYDIQLTTELSAGRDDYNIFYFQQTANGFRVEINEGDNGTGANPRRSNEFMVQVTSIR